MIMTITTQTFSGLEVSTMTTMPRGQAPVYKLKSRNLPVFLDRNTPVPTRSRKIKSLKIARSREEEADGKSVTTVTATM